MMENTPKDPFASSSINYWDIICRRRWWLLGSLVAAWALAVVAARVIPPTYTSHAIVLVSHTGIPNTYVELNVKADLAERMRNISQRILDRTHLEKIIEDYHLYPKLRGRPDPDLAIAAMQRDIEVDPLPADDATAPQGASNEDAAQAARRALDPQNGKTPDVIAFRLSYSAPNGIVAQQVATELVSLMIEANMQDRRTQSQTTTDFLQSQTAQVLDQMNLQQQKIQEYKTKYMGELPDQKESNLQALSQLQGRLQSANDALARAEQQKVFLHSQSSQYKDLQAGLVNDKPAANSPEAVDQQLEKLQKQLDDLRARYTDDYPDVRTLQKEIARLKAIKNAPVMAAVATAKNQGDDPPSIPRPKTYAELQALSPVLQIESQIKSNEAEIVNRHNEVAATEKQIAQYQKFLDETPLRDQELQTLTGNYDQLKATYDSLAAKSSQSQLATNLEKHDQGELWEILSPPNAPRKPSFPDRLLFSLGGLGAGLLIGIGLVVFQEFTDERIFDEQALKALIPRNVSILARIPPLPTRQERKSRYWKIALAWAAGTTMMAVIAAVTILAYFGG
jgi:uncharacterized protein involved in exopolysaccharide biosynthesis